MPNISQSGIWTANTAVSFKFRNNTITNYNNERHSNQSGLRACKRKICLHRHRHRKIEKRRLRSQGRHIGACLERSATALSLLQAPPDTHTSRDGYADYVDSQQIQLPGKNHRNQAARAQIASGASQPHRSKRHLQLHHTRKQHEAAHRHNEDRLNVARTTTI